VFAKEKKIMMGRVRLDVSVMYPLGQFRFVFFKYPQGKTSSFYSSLIQRKDNSFLYNKNMNHVISSRIYDAA